MNTKRPHALQAWFSYLFLFGIVVSTFRDLLRLIEKQSTQRLLKLRPVVVDLIQNPAGERGVKNIWKTMRRKVRQIVGRLVKNEVHNCGFFKLSLGSGATGAPGWSQGSLQAPSKVKIDWKLYTKGAHNAPRKVTFDWKLHKKGEHSFLQWFSKSFRRLGWKT